MRIRYNLLIRVLITVLGIIFVCEGLNLVFHFGLNHHLFHLFWLIVSFILGLFIGTKCVIHEYDTELLEDED